MEFFLFIICLILSLIALLLLWSKGLGGDEEICEIVNKRRGQKEDRQRQILEILKKDGKTSNKEIRRKLKISDRTAVRYMDGLEKQGKVQQVGKVGKHTHYKLK